MIEVCRRKNKITYKVIIRLPNRKRISKSFDRKCDASVWGNEHKGKFRHYENTRKEKATFQSASETWLTFHAEPKITTAFVEQAKQILRSYLFPFFGNIAISAITPTHVDVYVSQIRKKTDLKPASINKQIQLLKSILNFCYKRNWIPYNPVAGISLLRVDQQPFDYWSKEEAEQFLSYTRKKYEQIGRHWVYLFYLISLNTGMRLGEILGLSWRNINLHERFITVCRIREIRTGVIVERTKGKKIRHLGINDALFGALVTEKNMSYGDRDLVFSSHRDNPIDPDDFRRHYWNKDIRGAGVRYIRIHDMRHTFASHFVMAGGSLYDLQAILGHADMKTTERYAHLAPQHLQNKANVVQFSGNVVNQKPVELLQKFRQVAPKWPPNSETGSNNGNQVARTTT